MAQKMKKFFIEIEFSDNELQETQRVEQGSDNIVEILAALTTLMVRLKNTYGTES